MPHDSSPYIENGLACSSLHGLLSQIGHWRIKLPSLPHSSTHIDPWIHNHQELWENFFKEYKKGNKGDLISECIWKKYATSLYSTFF